MSPLLHGHRWLLFFLMSPVVLFSAALPSPGGMLTLALLLSFASPSLAGVTFFIDDAAGFNAAVAGLNFLGTEDWESSTLPPDNIAGLDDPLAPGVPNPPFPNGTNPAIQMTAQSNTLAGNPTVPSPHGPRGLVTASAGYAGTPTDQVSSNQPDQSFDMIFAWPNTIAVKFNPLVFDHPPSGDPGTATIRVYDSSNVLLGSAVDISVAGYTNPTTFVGVLATGDDDVGRINVYATSEGDVFSGADNIDVYAAPQVGVIGAAAPDVPEDPALGRNRPNPFNPSTTIDFILPEPGWVTLGVYDVDGRLMSSLVDGHRDAGYHSVIWNGDNDGGRSIASGVYIYRLQAGGRTLSRSMTLLK